MPSEAHRRANAKYDAANTIQVHLKLNVRTDEDIIRKLESAAETDPTTGKQGYIKALIRADIHK